MDEQNFHHQIGSDILRLIRTKSRQLAGKYGFAIYDGEDVEQELLLDYLKRAPSFKPDLCSRIGFARMIVRNSVSTLIDQRAAACRDYRARRIPVDLHRDGQSLNHGDTPNSWLADPNTRSVFEKLNLRIDVEQVLMRLPVALATICRLLMVCETSSEAASRAGISRATLYRQIHQVRALFAQAGMDK
jgi:RNA polymerase sigma factor (sigma-70 family)